MKGEGSIGARLLKLKAVRLRALCSRISGSTQGFLGAAPAAEACSRSFIDAPTKPEFTLGDTLSAARLKNQRAARTGYARGA